MKAHVTENFDLVLRWDEEAQCEVVWSACSECEFEVTTKLRFPPGLNYQGPTRLEFSTTCYAYALRFFADKLDDFAAGRRKSVKYCGSEDMTIRLTKRRGQADFADRSINVCVLKYQMMRAINMVVCDTEFELFLGRPEDPAGAAKAIREVIASLGIDASLEAPNNRRQLEFQPWDATGEKPSS